MTTDDLIFDDTLFADDGPTEKGLMALRAFVGGGHVQVKIEDDDLVLFTYFDHPDGLSDDIELGRINLYHVAGFTAQFLEDADQLDALATLFRNIAVLIERDAIVGRHPKTEWFFQTDSAPQFFLRPAAEEPGKGNDEEKTK